MGKSLGNVLDPNLLLSSYGKEPIRWFLLKDIALGSDGDFQHVRFVDIVNNDLANTIGNLLNRTSSMSRKWFNNRVPKIDKNKEDKLLLLSKEAIKNYIYYFNDLKIDSACKEILNFAINTNLYLNEKQPWVLVKDLKNIHEVKIIIYNVLESTRIIGLLLLPILPELSNKIDIQLGSLYKKDKNWLSQLEWGVLTEDLLLPSPEPIIGKLEYD